MYTGGWQCPVALVLPHTRPSKESVVLLSETEVDSCPAVVEQGRWIKNFSCPSAVNCTYEFQWRGIYCRTHMRIIIMAVSDIVVSRQ